MKFAETLFIEKVLELYWNQSDLATGLSSALELLFYILPDILFASAIIINYHNFFILLVV